jgi:hypothetical protein
MRAALALLALSCHGRGLAVPADAAPEVSADAAEALADGAAPDLPADAAAPDLGPADAPVVDVVGDEPVVDVVVDAPPGRPCGEKRCLPGQYCVVISPGQVPNPVCEVRPDGGCAADTTEGCGDGGLAACDIATIPPRCLDLPASCAGVSPCRCFCGLGFAGTCHGPDDHDIVCAYP